MEDPTTDALNQETTETTTDKKEAASKTLDDLLNGGDDSEAYQQQRGDKAREVVLGDDDPEDLGDDDDESNPIDASSINDEDRAAARLFFWFYDDTTAKLFSQNVYGTWDNSIQFRTYKDLSSPEYKDLIDCAAIVYKKWKFRWGPEMVIAVSLGTNLFMKFQLANQLKKQFAKGQAPMGDNIRNINTKKDKKQKPQAAML